MFKGAIIVVLLFQIVNSQSIIKTLPGFPGNLPFTLETGYIGVGELDEVQLFYYFVESERSPEFDPLLLWLTGGPGCSGVASLIYEIGPLAFNYEKSRVKPTLELNPYSWTKIANVIFLDAPVGTGFSYATTWQKYYSSDTLQGASNYEFLRKLAKRYFQWLLAHPKFQSNPLYITGDSYSGKIVPLLVQEIVNGNDIGVEPHMNLQGYVLGNPVTNDPLDINHRPEYAYLKALISEELYESAKRNCKGNYTYVDPSNVACVKDIQAFTKCTEKIFMSQILENGCSLKAPKPLKMERDHSSFIEEQTDILAIKFPPPTPWCRSYTYIPCKIWLNDKTVREALHIREGTVESWVRCNNSLWYSKDLPSSYEIHRMLIQKGLQVLIYSGDQDMSIPYVGTLKWIESLNLTINYEWNPWFVDGQVAGYWMQYYTDGNYQMTYATVKGAGHTAPEYKHKECFAMIDRWFDYFPL